MRTILALAIVLYSGAALAQATAPAAGSPPPTVGGKPLVQVKPRGSAPAPAPKNEHLSVAKKMLNCLDIDDATKGRLECFDAIFPPKPNPKAPAAKGAADCRFIKEEDDRLTCFNGFADKIPKF